MDQRFGDEMTRNGKISLHLDRDSNSPPPPYDQSIDELKHNVILQFNIYVKFSDGWILEVNVRSDDTIRDLKDKIDSKTNISVSNQHLWINGYEITNNDSKIEEYQIQQQTIIELIVDKILNPIVPHAKTHYLIFAIYRDSHASTHLLTFDIPYKPEIDVQGLKTLIHHKINIPQHTIEIMFDGLKLESNNKLSMYQIQDQSTIYIAHKNLNKLSGNKSFEIIVKTSRGLPFPIFVKSSMTIRQICSNIQNKIEIPVEQQRVIYKGGDLVMDLSIGDYQITSESEIRIVRKRINHQNDLHAKEFQIYVNTLTGKKIAFNVTSQNTIEELGLLIENREGIPIEQQRLIYKGNQLSIDDTLQICKIEPEDSILLVLRLSGGCVAAPMPSRFIQSDHMIPSSELIQQMHNIDPISIKGVISYPKIKILEPTHCKLLIDYLDNIVTNETDLLLTIDIKELEKLIGIPTVDQLKRHFNGPCDIIKLRRVVATGGCIDFHTDHAWRTMQIPLNPCSEYVGGRVIYKTDSGYFAMSREPGTASIHTNIVEHGVEPLTTGIRYSLFFCETAPRIQDNEFNDLVEPVLQELNNYQKTRHLSDSELILCVEQYMLAINKINSNTNLDPRFEFIRQSHVLSSESNVSVDTLVELVRHNERFLDQILTMNVDCHTIVQAIDRYRQFFSQLRVDRCLEPPDKLVDLIWHTHIQNSKIYQADCLRILGFVVNHIPN